MSSLQNAYDLIKTLIDTEVGVSNWITVDQPMIDQFATTTQDEQWIHKTNNGFTSIQSAPQMKHFSVAPSRMAS